VPSREGVGQLPAFPLDLGSLPTLLFSPRGEKHMQAHYKPSRTRSCPPHTPLLVQATGDGYGVVRCLACGLQGPKRESSSKARLAFEESYNKELE